MANFPPAPTPTLTFDADHGLEATRTPTASRPVAECAAEAPAWTSVNLPWRRLDSEARRARDRLSDEYAAWFGTAIEGQLPSPPSVDGWEFGRMDRAEEILAQLTSSLCDPLGGNAAWRKEPTWGDGAGALDWGNEEAFAALCAACTDPDARALAARRRHRAILDRIEATSPACADWLRRIEEASARIRSEQFATHPMCRPGVALQIRRSDGTVRPVLIGDCDPGGRDLASPLVADDDVVLAILDLRVLYQGSEEVVDA